MKIYNFLTLSTGGCVTQNYETGAPVRSVTNRDKTKFKSKFAESLQNIYTFSSSPLRCSREACEDEISEKKDAEDHARVEGDNSLADCESDVRDDEKLDGSADSNCEVEIIS